VTAVRGETDAGIRPDPPALPRAVPTRHLAPTRSASHRMRVSRCHAEKGVPGAVPRNPPLWLMYPRPQQLSTKPALQRPSAPAILQIVLSHETLVRNLHSLPIPLSAGHRRISSCLLSAGRRTRSVFAPHLRAGAGLRRDRSALRSEPLSMNQPRGTSACPEPFDFAQDELRRRVASLAALRAGGPSLRAGVLSLRAGGPSGPEAELEAGPEAKIICVASSRSSARNAG
jgi:hypothetical protein